MQRLRHSNVSQFTLVAIYRRVQHAMHDEFTAIIERDGDWHVGTCPEVPGANGQGRTIEQCKEDLADPIALILEDPRQDGLRGVPEGERQQRRPRARVGP